MAFNIMNMFKGGNTPMTPQNQQQSQQSQQTPAAPTANFQTPPDVNNPADPKRNGHATQQSSTADPNAEPQQQQSNSGESFPLDEFKDLFNNKDSEGNEVQQDPASDEFFSYDPEKLQQNISKLNFLSPEQVQDLGSKALQGDSEALGNLLNGLAQSVYSKSIEAAIGVSNRTAASATDRMSKSMDTNFRSLSADETLTQLNPKFQHEAFQPLVKMVKSQFEQKYPDASSKQLADMVNRYMSETAKLLSSPGPDLQDRSSQNNPPDIGEKDFSGFFGQN